MNAFSFSRLASLSIGLGWLVFGCNKEQDSAPQPQTSATITTNSAASASTKSIVLGHKLENPYSFDNMSRAYNSLSTYEKSTFNIRITHQYIRFSPRTETEYDLLTNDSTITIFNHPLDYELSEGDGGSYHDPELLDNKPTYQYAVVPYPYSSSNIVSYIVLSNLYLPEEDPLLDKNSNITANNISSLVQKAEDLVDSNQTPPVYSLPQGAESVQHQDNIFSVTGDSFSTKKGNISTQGANGVVSYHAQGKLQVFDTRYGGLIPLSGVKVRVRRWFTCEDAVTDENGNYYISRSFERPVNYAIFYERNDFDIRSGALGQAWYNGPKQSAPWNLDIMSGAHRLYAHINRAASDYYYRNGTGIKSPPKNSFWKAAVKIAAYDDAGTLGSHCKDCRIFGLLPRLYIHSNGDGGERFSDEIYGTTIHELAHASHWEFRRNNWNSSQTESRLKESWAEGVEWYLTVRRYHSYGDRPFRNDNYQNRLLTSPLTLTYSPIAVDLFDRQDQSVGCSGPGCIRDPAEGFTFQEMESALHGANGFEQWRENLLNQPGHQSLRLQVEILFDNYL